ncbi:MAG: RluA family pseudouridine synthase [Clostridia bacterium]|nr:RluA family pseudouridine synthase [Clostridia bacterium]
MNKKMQIICDSDNQRIDSFLTGRVGDFSRSYIQKLIQDDAILVDSKKVKTNYRLKLNQVIEIDLPEPKEAGNIPQDIRLDVLYEDDDIIVINKDKGMVVHPAPGHIENTLVNALLSHCKGKLSDINGIKRPGIVHRIDKDTSGILVVAKSNQAHQGLAQLFKKHDIDREYTALVHGIISEDAGTINAPIGRDENNRKRMAVNFKNGKYSFTKFEVIKRYNGFTLIKAVLETGRTHQIRVHLSYIGHPLVGDSLYLKHKDSSGIEGQLLHAGYLGFIHPITKEKVEFKSELPQYFKEFLKGLTEYE